MAPTSTLSSLARVHSLHARLAALCERNASLTLLRPVPTGNFCFLFQRDEIGLLKPCGGDEQPPYAYIFHDLTDGCKPL